MEDKLDSFEEELSWCVEQLELGLESQNPNSKQGTSLVLSSSFDSYAFHSEVGKGGGGDILSLPHQIEPFCIHPLSCKQYYYNISNTS